MKKSLSCLLLLFIAFSSCKKDLTKQNSSELQSSQTMERFLIYRTTGIQNGVYYGTAAGVRTYAGFEDSIPTGEGKNCFYMSFEAGKTNVGTSLDLIKFQIPVNSLKKGYVGTYSLAASDMPPIREVRYAYRFPNDNGNASSILDNLTGVRFEGQFIIKKFDAGTNTISGSYEVLVKDMAYDPTIKSSQPGYVNPCNLNVKGTFANIKIH